jgi:isocitrate dehydrogenase kinase/phosphatase
VSEPAEAVPILGRLAAMVARGILHGFFEYYAEFSKIMARSKRRFEDCDWPGLQDDAHERLTLYGRAIDGTAGYVEAMVSDRVEIPEFWERMRRAYEELSMDPANGDLARAYFSTVKRRFIPVDAQDFLPSHIEVPHQEHFEREVHVFEPKVGADAIESLLRAIIAMHPFQTKYADLDGDVKAAAALLEDRLSAPLSRRPVAVLKPIFYRARKAHIIGRIWSAGRYRPLVITLTNSPAGIRVGDVLLGDEETSSLFSFTRSQFHVVTDHHREMMGFLKSLAPAKSPADLYASVGYNNLSKSAVLADLFKLVEQPKERFRRTSGISGTVMIAFELPGSRFVLKIIRDRFLTRRVDTTRDKVMRRYRFVQHCERAGRILDIFHFQHVRFERAWFAEDLLEEIKSTAPSKITVDDRHIILREFYVQRKVIPLDVFFRGPIDPSVMRRVVIDFGFLHKELAARNIFTGDVVPNNFGVVSVGRRAMRVVSFDYDGYSRLTDMRFLQNEVGPEVTASIASNPWSVYDDWEAPEDRMVIDEEWDVIPDKFRMTFGVPEPFKEEFGRVHGELYSARYWIDLQAELRRRREFVEAFPYPMIARSSESM